MNTPNIRQSLYQCLENTFTIADSSEYIFLCEATGKNHCMSVYAELDNNFMSFTISNGDHCTMQYANIATSDTVKQWYDVYCTISGESYKYYLRRYLSSGKVSQTNCIIRKEIKYGNFSNLLSAVSKDQPANKLLSFSDDYNYVSNGRYLIDDDTIYFNTLTGKTVYTPDNTPVKPNILTDELAISNNLPEEPNHNAIQILKHDESETSKIILNDKTQITDLLNTKNIKNEGAICSKGEISTNANLTVNGTSLLKDALTTNNGIINTSGGITSTGDTKLEGNAEITGYLKTGPISLYSEQAERLKIFANNEGGNIRFNQNANGVNHHWEMDAYNGDFRIYHGDTEKECDIIYTFPFPKTDDDTSGIVATQEWVENKAGKNITPTKNDTYDIGSTNLKYKNLYLSNSISLGEKSINGIIKAGETNINSKTDTIIASQSYVDYIIDGITNNGVTVDIAKKIQSGIDTNNYFTFNVSNTNDINAKIESFITNIPAHTWILPADEDTPESKSTTLISKTELTTLNNEVNNIKGKFTGDDAKNALKLGGKDATDYVLKTDKVAESNLDTVLAKKINDKADASTVNTELAKKAVKSDVEEALKLKATVIAQEATEEKAQKNKEDIAAMDTAYKAADTAIKGRLATVEGKLENVSNVMDFRGAVSAKPANIKGYHKGDVIVVTAGDDKGKEFVCDGTTWVEFGDSSAEQAAISALQEKDKTHEASISALESNSATKTELSTLEGKVNKKAEQSALDAANYKIAELEGKPANSITTKQVESWDGEVGAKTKATANESALKTKVEQNTFDILNDTVTNSSTGLVKKVGDLETSVGTKASTEALKAVKATAEAAQTKDQVNALIGDAIKGYAKLNDENNTGSLKISGTMTANSFYASSDIRLKKNIVPYKCDKSILDLEVKEFDYKNTDEHTIGCIAQDLQKICPQIVHESEDGYLRINESKIVYLLLDEVKQMQNKIDSLESRLTQLEKLIK